MASAATADTPRAKARVGPSGFARGAWRARVVRIPRALKLILLVAAVQSLAWNIALPAFQGPDEQGHFGYLQHLAETGDVPSATSGPGGYSTEAFEASIWLNLLPTITNTSNRPAWSAADLDRWHEIESRLPAADASNGSGPNPIAKNPPLYYAAMAVPYRLFGWLPLLKRLFVLRLINALFYLATVALTWLIAGEVFAQARWKQTLATSVVALEPQLSFMSAVINADSMLIALCSGFLLAALRLVKRGPSMSRVLTASVLAAAAVLTHGRGLVTLPVLGVALLVALLTHRPGVRAALVRSAAAVATVGVAFLGYVAFGKGAGAGALYGGQAADLNAGAGFNLGQFISFIYQFYLPRLPSLTPRIGPAFGYRQVFITTFYGSFGSLEVTFPQRVYDALQAFSALGLVGFYTAIVVRWRKLRDAWPVVVVLLALLLTMLGFLHYVSYRALLSTGGAEPLLVGRYLLPMVPLFGLAIAFTVGALPRRLAAVTGATIVSGGVLLSLAGIALTMARFYA